MLLPLLVEGFATEAGRWVGGAAVLLGRVCWDELVVEGLAREARWVGGAGRWGCGCDWDILA